MIRERRVTYDDWSRLITTLPEESVINRSYATHSSDELATMLEVVHSDGATRTLAGEQKFEGLQRLTGNTGLDTLYHSDAFGRVDGIEQGAL
ncbi:hypothetical protein N018_09490 [Pseudomonas syringae CC1557]|uniref:Uncharacterized protein n=1 Tax=Pseudomonas syringae CC1557 TaxID=1357279 RepID=W0N241_PSESX|nr:hypothetical protein [Pseudomonas syringae]AHG43535.1 hypothetical protein N018_09490 [Pseudomonas syringae CC1557]